MTDEQRSRPVGWWLKEADARLSVAFDRILEGSEVDRRGWQVLSSLTSFDSPAAVHGVVGELEARG